MENILKLATLLGLINKKALNTLINGGSIAIDTNGNITYHDDNFDDSEDEENKEIVR